MLDAVKNSSFVKGVCHDTNHQPSGLGKPLYLGGRVVSFGVSIAGSVLEVIIELVAMAMFYTGACRNLMGETAFWGIRGAAFRLCNWNQANVVPHLEHLLQDIRFFSNGETFQSRYPKAGNQGMPLVSRVFC